MKKALNVILMVFHALVILFCMLSCIYTIAKGGENIGLRIPAVVTLAALISAVYYAISGYKKSVATAHKTMLTFCGAASLMCIFSLMYETKIVASYPFLAAFTAVLFGVCFGLYLVLAFVPNLGKLKSNVIIIIVFVVFYTLYYVCQIAFPGSLIGDGTKYDTMRNMSLVCMSALAFNAGICNHFKYEDKSNRKKE